jgi:DNA-binding transcriptional ArsR family regulator
VSYLARVNRIEEAKPITLEGQRLMVFSALGHAHVVSLDVFELLFAEEQEQAAAPLKVRAVAKKRPARRSASDPKTAESTGGVSTRDALIAEIRKGPITSGEAKDVLRRAGLSEASAYTALGKLKEEGVIEKRECPQTHLDKWYPSAKVKGAAA